MAVDRQIFIFDDDIPFIEMLIEAFEPYGFTLERQLSEDERKQLEIEDVSM